MNEENRYVQPQNAKEAMELIQKLFNQYRNAPLTAELLQYHNNLIMRLQTDIKQAADDVLDECFVPQYLTGKRRPDGTWIPSKERLFPGYLICVTSQVDELADKLRRVRSLTKILGNDNAFIPLTEDERAWVQKVTQKDQRTVGESVGYMEDGKLVIVEGPLKGREDWVRKVNHRKRLAYLEMPMGGRTVRAQAGLQIVNKAQGKLLDREK